MKIAIQGHPTRGKEVIQILESLGGRNTFNYNGDYIRTAYFIGMDYSIYGFCTDSPKVGFKVYTLEEFEKEFPFKVGDKVFLGKNNEHFYTIKSIKIWFDGNIAYELAENEFHYAANKLTLYKEMKEERNITLTLDKAKEWYNKGGELKEIALQAFNEKELNPLPRSWEEFCEKYPVKETEAVICCDSSIADCKGLGEKRDLEYYRDICPSKKSAEAHLAMIQLEQLRDCWRQGWEPIPHQTAFAIKFAINGLGVYEYCSREFLSFKDRKTATEFLKCFKDLIEKAGDLI